MASIAMKDIPISTLHNIILSNQYLALPRLSSQGVLEELCPCGWNRPRMKICVALVTDDSSEHDLHRQAFRQYAQKFPYANEKVRFAYIYHKRQASFINALRPGMWIPYLFESWLNMSFRRRVRRAFVKNCSVLEKRYIASKVRMGASQVGYRESREQQSRKIRRNYIEVAEIYWKFCLRSICNRKFEFVGIDG